MSDEIFSGQAPNHQTAIQDELTRHNRELALLNRVIAAATSRLEPNAVLEMVCRELALAFNVPQAGAALLNDSGTALTVVAEYVADDRPSALGIVIPVDDNPSTQYVLEHKAPLAVGDASSDPRTEAIQDIARERGTVSYLILPLLVRDEVVGTLALTTAERREYTDEEIDLAASAAMATAQALENARLFYESRRINAELGIARDQAQEASRARSALLANMSHELRTPLNAIIGYSEMLEEDIRTLGHAKIARDLRKVRDAGQHLLDLINGILDLSSIEAGKMTLNIGPFGVSDLVAEITEVLQVITKKNANTFTIQCADDVGEMVADRVKVRQSLNYLLDNANKFTEQGHITFEVMRRAGGEGDWIEFSVRDTGIGIAPDKLREIFELFTLGDSSPTRRHSGIGLGLVLSQRLCELMGGRVIVESELNEGSVFTVRLPARVDKHIGAFDTKDLTGSLGSYENTILVVNDDAVERNLIDKFLAQQGLQIKTASGGEIGLWLAKEHDLSAIVLDMVMPGMDGWAMLTALKSDAELADIPVVMMMLTEGYHQGYMLSIYDYLTRPLNRQQLALILKRLGQSSGHILVIDDDPQIQTVLTEVLVGSGWRITAANDMTIAMEHVATQTPDLILLNLVLPDANGLQFVAEMRSTPEWRDIPIVAMLPQHLTPAKHRQLHDGLMQVLQPYEYRREQVLRDTYNFIVGYVWQSTQFD